MNTTLEFIRQKCIEASPEIVELKFGCQVQWQGTKFVFNGDISTDNTDYHLAGKRQIGVVGRNDYLSEKDCEIVGRPIRLADVLLAMDKFASSAIHVDNHGCFFFASAHDVLAPTKAWNLRNDDLNEQSEETINFLADLLQ
jgi:hypothetical protein